MITRLEHGTKLQATDVSRRLFHYSEFGTCVSAEHWYYRCCWCCC